MNKEEIELLDKFSAIVSISGYKKIKMTQKQLDVIETLSRRGQKKYFLKLLLSDARVKDFANINVEINKQTK